MASIVVLYESKYGQSEKIARHIASLAPRSGHAAAAWRCSAVPSVVLHDSDALVVVAPVYYGRHHAGIESFLVSHAGTIAERSTAFVSVSLGAASTHAIIRTAALRMARDFLEQVRCEPRLVLTVGGARSFPEYGRVLRLLAWGFSWFAGGPIDTTRIHEETDWEALDAAILPFLAQVGENEAAALSDRNAELRLALATGEPAIQAIRY